MAQQLLRRYGIVTRESVAAESVPGGFAAVYEVFKGLEESGRVRRGYFATGVGAAQFALPAALEQLRLLRDPPEAPEVVVLAATDPANPYGAILPWPVTVRAADGRCSARWAATSSSSTARPPRISREADASSRSGCPRTSRSARGRRGQWRGCSPTSRCATGSSSARSTARRPASIPLAAALAEAGFVASALGFSVRRSSARV